MPSNHLIVCRPLLPPAFNLSQHHGLLQWVISSHQVAKILEFQLQHQSFLYCLLTRTISTIYMYIEESKRYWKDYDHLDVSQNIILVHYTDDLILWTGHVKYPAAAAAKSLQSCPTLCDPIDGSPPGSRPWDSPGKNTGVGCHCLLQCMKVKSESEVAQLCPTLATPWTAAYQAPLPMRFSRQEWGMEWGAIAFSGQVP